MSSKQLEPRPRHYARQIIAKGTLAERNAALQEVPEHLRALTKRHCLNTWGHPAYAPKQEAKPAND
ncbi:hypothetical protein [Pseudomonas sp. CC6-YY-74]|uniref:hypothetical protein n=1 Tax=Pseudomonas sp. CC6-YY-74 TaxID=1930532 RepID=UPI0009A1C2BA|nr:hypothetical protein [Pseudomonas sp. CC6-YY-74]